MVHVRALSRDDWELIILPNNREPDEWNDIRIRIEPSGKVGPAKKRDLGAVLARGKYLVFLDDDSYPSTCLLDIANHYFEDQSLVGLGGPAITPVDDNFWQRVSGAVFLSKFSGGNPERYMSIGEPRPVDDWPSVNLMVRRAAFLKIGGFNSPYWPGEDTKLCLDLVRGTGKKILYVPEMRVWHHRRSGLTYHLKQVGGYGIHRGYFAKRYPATSLRLMYFIPSAFALFTIASVLAPLILPSTVYLFLFGWAVYAATLLKAWLDIGRHESWAVATMAVPYTLATHWWYGIRFMQGLLTRNLISRLR